MTKIKRTFFISGHRDITDKEFKEIYVPRIIDCALEYDAYFIMGDYDGVDIMAQDFLINELNYDINKICVYHMGLFPMHINENVINTKPYFENDEHRDSTMTKDSDEDIAFIREGKNNSGTAQNILRRLTFKTDI